MNWNFAVHATSKDEARATIDAQTMPDAARTLLKAAIDAFPDLEVGGVSDIRLSTYGSFNPDNPSTFTLSISNYYPPEKEAA